MSHIVKMRSNHFHVNRFSLKAVKYCLLFSFFVNQAYGPALAKEITPEWRYSVRQGDTLIHFAKRHLINPADWRVLQTLNNIKNPYRMPLGLIVRVPLNLLKQMPAAAEVVLVSGHANIKSVDNTIQPAAVGNKLGVGTLLITGENSKINVKFADGSIVTVESNSTLKLDTLSLYGGGGMVDTKLRLQQGKLDVVANPTHKQSIMQIYTPTAVAAVRGTQFRVSAEAMTVRQETLDGRVALSAAGEEVAVAKGYGSSSENGNPPLPPVLLLSAPIISSLATKFESVPITFALPMQEGAIAFLGKVSSDAQFNTILGENLSQKNQLTFNDIPDGQHYLKVRAKDNKGLEGYDATHTFVLNARPFAPQSITPAPAAIVRDANPELAWNKVGDAKTYLLELAHDNQFKNMVDSRQLSSTVLKLEKPLQPGEYFWRLASIDGADKGPYATANNFTYKVKPSAPDISQLTVKVLQNRVYVNTINPPEGLAYDVNLSNDMNSQKNVWFAKDLSGQFKFLLKEFGKQTLTLRHIEADGVTGPESVYEFMALPQ